jgi:hypothetical protein
MLLPSCRKRSEGGLGGGRSRAGGSEEAHLVAEDARFEARASGCAVKGARRGGGGVAPGGHLALDRRGLHPRPAVGRLAAVGAALDVLPAAAGELELQFAGREVDAAMISAVIPEAEPDCVGLPRPERGRGAREEDPRGREAVGRVDREVDRAAPAGVRRASRGRRSSMAVTRIASWKPPCRFTLDTGSRRQHAPPRARRGSPSWAARRGRRPPLRLELERHPARAAEARDLGEQVGARAARRLEGGADRAGKAGSPRRARSRSVARRAPRRIGAAGGERPVLRGEAAGPLPS